MNRDEWGRAEPASSERRIRALVRVVPLPEKDGSESLALAVLFVSAMIAIMAGTLATALF
jgi:hypothetical protein